MVRTQSEAERLREFSRVLREARRALPADTAHLGATARQQGRLGRRVSQEDVADAVGVSRVWYALLESGRAARASARLLERLCDALMLDQRQCGSLFQLGIPELWVAAEEAAS